MPCFLPTVAMGMLWMKTASSCCRTVKRSPLKDQFRRGSYIALKEQVDPNLYDTFWTVYENDAPVTNVSGASERVMTDPDIKSLENVKGTAPKDGRTEKVIEGDDKKGNPIKNEYSSISMKPTD